MSVVTLTLTDEDLDAGRYAAEIDVEGSKIDDGYLTAAHLTGIFIMRFIHTPEFQKMVWAFAEDLASNPGCAIQNLNQSPDAAAA